MLNYPTYGLTPAKGSLDTSFDQGSGFDKSPLGIASNGDNYVVLGGTNSQNIYNSTSSINSNSYSPFFRVMKANKLPYFYDNIGNNLNSANTLTKYSFVIVGGYIYIVGSFTYYGTNETTHMLKINQNDMSFALGNSGVGFSISAQVQIRYANGKIFAGRTAATTYNGGPSAILHVFDTDLVEDTTLTNFFLPNNAITCIFEQADGKVIMSGSFTNIGGTTQNRIVRYNTDWTVDSTFTTNVGTGPSAGAIDIKQLSDGKLVLGGSFTSFNGTNSQRVIVLNTDGTIANAVASGFSSGQVNSIAIDGSNNIYCGGTFSLFDGSTRVGLCKLSSTLTLDATYLPVMNAGSQVFALGIDSTNLYIGTGNARTTNGTTVNGIFSTDLTNGTLQSDFVGGVNANVRQLYIDTNEVYIYTGLRVKYGGNYNYGGENTYLVNFLSKDGLLIKNYDKFESTGSFNISNYHKDSDDEYIVTSVNTNYGLSTTKGVAKFSDGKIDYSYIANIGSNIFTSIYDNGVIVGGNFTSPKKRIVKLDSTGGVDATFDVGTGFGNNSVLWITLLSTGKYLVSGTFTTYKGLSQTKMVVLNTDGSVDSSFVVGTGPSGGCRTYELQDGNYLVWGDPSDGSLTTRKGVACNRIIKVSPTGDIISFLSANIVATTINNCLEYDGKIYVFSNATNDGVNTITGLACYELDGTPVNLFGTKFGITSGTVNITGGIIDDGKLVVVGNFTDYDGNPVGGVARIFI